MKQLIRDLFPYYITITLWYLSAPRFNPFGVLALIPIFYYMFYLRAKYWTAFGFLVCFLLDFSAGTKFLFSALFLLANVLNTSMGIFENDNSSRIGVRKFGMFTGIMALLMLVYAIFNTNHFFGFVFGIIWLYLWLFVMYIPLVVLFRRVEGD